MEKIFANVKDLKITIRTRYPSRIYLPKAVYQQMKEAVNDVYSVDMFIDDSQLWIVPNNKSGEFLLSNNGSSPHGRNVSLPKIYTERYNVSEGHFRCVVDHKGKVLVNLLEKA